MSRVVNSVTYRCLECRREYRAEKCAIECEIEDKERQRVVRDSLDRSKVFSSLTILVKEFPDFYKWGMNFMPLALNKQ